jgi:NAD+ synthase (glutamine-hydrolysing)
MSHLVLRAAKDGDVLVTEDLKRIVGRSALDASFSAAAITRSVLHTVYMGTANSTAATRDRAALLASEISSYHQSFSIDTVVSAVGEWCRLISLTSLI